MRYLAEAAKRAQQLASREIVRVSREEFIAVVQEGYGLSRQDAERQVALSEVMGSTIDINGKRYGLA